MIMKLKEYINTLALSFTFCINDLPSKYTYAHNVDLLHLLCPMASKYKSNHHQNMSPGSQEEFNRSLCLDQTLINQSPPLEK